MVFRFTQTMPFDFASAISLAVGAAFGADVDLAAVLVVVAGAAGAALAPGAAALAGAAAGAAVVLAAGAAVDAAAAFFLDLDFVVVLVDGVCVVELAAGVVAVWAKTRLALSTEPRASIWRGFIR